MKNRILPILFLLTLSFAWAQQKKPVSSPVVVASNYEADKAAIKSMAGIYKVSFDFAETFSPDTGYKYFPRYREWGIEYVFVVEETANKIALQHLLIVGDTMIVKHWRQDWVYENKEVYKYYKDRNWIINTLTDQQAKGTWTQKVFQVDDSPRYEGYGTWVHADGRHFWESVADAPLPRREATKRSDYNVMRRHSRMEIFADGWVLDQDNEKILRNNGIDKLLCWEKGIERFTKGSYDATPALKYWKEQDKYWADVRTVWDKTYAANKDLKLQSKVDSKFMFETLFGLGDQYCKGKIYVPKSAEAEITKAINSYLIK